MSSWPQLTFIPIWLASQSFTKAFKLNKNWVKSQLSADGKILYEYIQPPTILVHPISIHAPLWCLWISLSQSLWHSFDSILCHIFQWYQRKVELIIKLCELLLTNLMRAFFKKHCKFEEILLTDCKIFFKKLDILEIFLIYFLKSIATLRNSFWRTAKYRLKINFQQILAREQDKEVSRKYSSWILYGIWRMFSKRNNQRTGLYFLSSKDEVNATDTWLIRINLDYSCVSSCNDEGLKLLTHDQSSATSSCSVLAIHQTPLSAAVSWAHEGQCGPSHQDLMVTTLQGR